MDVTIKMLAISELYRIELLWEKLRLQHLALSPHFKEYFAQLRFETRCEKFRSMPEQDVYIVATEDEDGALVGYCICSAHGETGELESIYVEPEYRGQHTGYRLASDGVEWMRRKGCRHIDVLVAEGNEDVFPFYERLGFRARGTVLRIK